MSLTLMVLSILLPGRLDSIISCSLTHAHVFRAEVSVQTHVTFVQLCVE